MLLGTRDLQLQPALSPVTALDRDLAPLSCEEKLVVVREQLAEVGGYFYKSTYLTNCILTQLSVDQQSGEGH